MLGLPSIISLILTLIARKYLKVIEIVGPIFLLTTIATLITLNTNHVKGYNARLESDRTRMQLFYCNMVYMITVLLLTTSYLQHLLVRIIFMVPFYTSLYWQGMTGSPVSQVAFVGTVTLWAIAEASLRVNYMAKAKLFIES